MLEQLALRIPVYVGPQERQAIRMPATLFLYADRLRIETGRDPATHPRRPGGPPLGFLAERPRLVCSLKDHSGACGNV
jgi:hypothetical protein